MRRVVPPFRADHVGSLLRPKSLHEARAKFAKGEISASDLKAVEDREIERVIKKQEDVGLQAITDGEFRRSWWHLDFLWGLDGAEKHVMDTGIAFAAVTTRNEGVKVTGKLGMAGPHPMVEHFKFVAAHTRRTPKITIPAPSAIYGRPSRTPISNKAYPSMDAFWDDLGNAYKKAVRGFADAGCRYLQLDEVFIAMLCDPKYCQQMRDRGDDPDKLGPLYGKLINDGDVGHSLRHDDHDASVPRQLQIDLHGRRRLRRGGRGAVQPDQRARLLHGVRHRARRRLRAAAAGAEGQAGRAGPGHHQDRQAREQGHAQAPHRRGGEVRPARSACLSGQCGFASTEEGNTLTEDEQWAKLRLIVEVADEVWGR